MFKVKPKTTLKTKTIDGLNQVVTEIPWIYQINTDGLDHHVSGPPLKLNSPARNSFISYSALTEETINNWIETSLTEDQKSFYRSVEAEVRQQLLSEEPLPSQAFTYKKYMETTESPLPF